MRRKQIVIKKLEELDFLFKNLKYSINRIEPDKIDQIYQMIQRVMDDIFVDVESEDEK
jgi:hypothetical protein